jgi:hypothetical protein
VCVPAVPDGSRPSPSSRALVAVLLFILLLGSVAAESASATVLRPGSWVTDGPASSAVTTDDASYAAGDLGSVRAATGGGLVLPGAGAGTPAAADFPRVQGTVTAAVSDGSGGWFIGGTFDRVGGLPRHDLAHVDARGGVDPAWAPAPDPTLFGVRALLRVGSTLMVAKNMDGLAHGEKNHLGGFDTITGAPHTGLPEVTGAINAMALRDGTVYLAGDLRTVGGLERSGIASFNPSSGAVGPLDPPVGPVSEIAISDDVVYAVGPFTSAGGEPRNGLAAASLTSGRLTAWDPQASDAHGEGQPAHIAATDGAVFVGGRFDRIGGVQRLGLAALDPDTGRAIGWAGPQREAVTALAVQDSSLYIAADESNPVDRYRGSLFRADIRTGAVGSFYTPTGEPVRTIAAGPGAIYAGGSFVGAGPALAEGTRRIVRILPDGSLDTDWQVTVDGAIYAIARRGSTLYAVGDFSTVGSQERRGAAAIDLRTAETLPWDPRLYFSSRTRSIAVGADTVFIGGSLDTRKEDRSGALAAFDATTAEQRTWDVDANNQSDRVAGLTTGGEQVFVRGIFGGLGGVRSPYLAAVDGRTGQITPWGERLDQNDLTNFAATAETLYLSGPFSNFGSPSKPRRGLAAVDLATGATTPWDPQVEDFEGYNGDRGVSSIVPAGDRVYLSGGFAAAGGAPRRGLAAVDAVTGAATTWDPDRIVDPPTSFYPVAVGEPGRFGSVGAAGSGRVLVVGAMLGVDGRVTGGVAQITDPSELEPAVDRAAPSVVITSPPDGARYPYRSPPTPRYSCDDEAGGTGVFSCLADDDVTHPASPTNPGVVDDLHTLTVTGTDRAGNRTRRVTRWTVDGYVQPPQGGASGTVYGWPPPLGPGAPPSAAQAPGPTAPGPSAGVPSAVAAQRPAITLISPPARLNALMRCRPVTLRVGLSSRGRLTTTVRLRDPKTILARGTLLGRRGTESLQLKPSRSCSRSLRGRRSVPVRVGVAFRPDRGRPMRQTVDLRLRR